MEGVKGAIPINRMKPAWAAAMAVMVAASLGAGGPAPAEDRPAVRAPAVAGVFYPRDAGALAKTVDGLLAGAAPADKAPRVIALIAPHAGYEYSGAVAAASYAIVKRSAIHRVVVIAPSHYAEFPFSAVYDGDAYATPLGRIPLDKEFARRLAAQNPLIKLADNGHLPSSGRGEHALEVQLPFLQRRLDSFELVPIIMGTQSYQASRALGVALAKLIRGPDTLVVASSDLSHFHSYEEAVALDRATLTATEQWDYLSLSHNFQTRTWEACGGGPIVAAMIAAERLGANDVRVLKYANSGDVTGERQSVVGYAAVALVQSEAKTGKRPKQEISLSRHQQDELLKLAKKSVETLVREGTMFQPLPAASDSLLKERGAFVTLSKKSQLRGCVGYAVPVKPLYLAVRDAAALAAVRDSRFVPVRADELAGLQYEITVLSPFCRVADMRQIRIGEHGLLVKKGDQEGILLPQVAREQGWDRKTFLAEACIKAGLPADAWREDDTDVFLFSALVFGEGTRQEAIMPDESLQRQPPGPPSQRERGWPPQ